MIWLHTPPPPRPRPSLTSLSLTSDMHTRRLRMKDNSLERWEGMGGARSQIIRVHLDLFYLRITHRQLSSNKIIILEIIFGFICLGPAVRWVWKPGPVVDRGDTPGQSTPPSPPPSHLFSGTEALTINVPLFKKLRDIIFFGGAITL